MDELSNEKKHEIDPAAYFPTFVTGAIRIFNDISNFARTSPGHALAIYNGPLRVRYPEDSSRVVLPQPLPRERYSLPLPIRKVSFSTSPSKLALRIAVNIDLIVAPLERADLSDAFAPSRPSSPCSPASCGGDSEAALALLSGTTEFSRVLEHRSVLSRRALELVREYDAVAQPISPPITTSSRAAKPSKGDGAPPQDPCEGRGFAQPTEERIRFLSRAVKSKKRRKLRSDDAPSTSILRELVSERRRSLSGGNTRLASPGERTSARILREILESGAKTPTSSGLAFLYSRKYGSNHYEIFRAVKSGRQRGSQRR